MFSISDTDKGIYKRNMKMRASKEADIKMSQYAIFKMYVGRQAYEYNKEIDIKNHKIDIWEIF